MEIKRERLPAPVTGGTDLSNEDFRIRQLRARDMLRGDLGDEDLEKYVRGARADHDAGQGGRVGTLQRAVSRRPSASPAARSR